MASSFLASGAARWLVSVAIRLACCVACSSTAFARASAASLDCTSTSNGRGSIRYSGSPAFTSLPWSNRRSTMMPETRGRTSETRVGAMRPGNSRTIERARGWTTTMLTSGSFAAAAGVAEVGWSQPAKSGTIAASINAMHAGCAR